MPNGPTHQLLGALSGAAAAHHYVSPCLSPVDSEAGTPLLIVGGLVAGGFGGRLPDLLDPPIQPNHRAFFHSIVLGAAVAGAAVFTVKKLRLLSGSPLKDKRSGARSTTGGDETVPSTSISLDQALLFALVLALLVSVLSHLGADSGTPKGLPILG